MGTKARRRLAIIVTGMLLAALTIVNIVPVAADDSVFTDAATDSTSFAVIVDGSVSP